MKINMRIFLIGLVIFSLPVIAEERTDANATPQISGQNIAERLDRLERAINNKTLLEIFDSMQALKLEVSQLRGEIEVQDHTIKQLKRKQRELYSDLEQRLQTIQANQSNVLTPAKANSNKELASKIETPAKPTQMPNDTKVDDRSANSAKPAANQTTVATNEPVAKQQADPVLAKSSYQTAFKLLQQAKYDQAAKSFKEFLVDYPNSAFADNAQYWLSESHYIMQQYDLAIHAYQSLLNTYPDSKKAPHSLLKIGLSYAELGNIADAKKILNKVITQFPETTIARLANDRLKKINTAAP